MNRIFRALAALALLLSAAPAFAWWDYGHRSVATIAMAEVTPQTRAAIRAVVRQSAVLQTPGCPVHSIEDASVWPDCIKPLGDRFSYAYSWHYQDVDVCAPFALKPACADGNCAARQIERAARMLKDRTLPTLDRIEALAFLVHIVGDLHQPLHAGERHDQGGNTLKASYGLIAGRTNFHSVWDGLLADRAISSPPGGPAGILSEVPVADRPAIRAGSVEDWSRDSWTVAHQAYADFLGGDGCGPEPAGRTTFTAAMIDRQIPILRRQVAKGGLRLAQLLDESLGGATPDPSRVPKVKR